MGCFDRVQLRAIAILSAHDFKICAARLALFYLIAPDSVLPRLSSAASRLVPLSFMLRVHSFLKKGVRPRKTALLRIKILFSLKTDPDKDKIL